jgi:hypothetical protein
MDASNTLLIGTCSAPGCGTLTLGTLCARHDTPVARLLPRGRPFIRAAADGGVASRPRAPLATGRL